MAKIPTWILEQILVFTSVYTVPIGAVFPSSASIFFSKKEEPFPLGYWTLSDESEGSMY